MATPALLEARTEAFFSKLDGWSQTHLTYRSSPTEWSALQVLEHLVKTEEGVLALARQGALDPHRIGVRDRLGFLFVMKVFQTDRRVKVPGSAAQVLPGPELAFEGLRTRWQSTRSDFQAFQAQLTPKQARLGLFRHPVIGWMGTQQITDFFWVHIVHHTFQIDRLRAQMPA